MRCFGGRRERTDPVTACLDSLDGFLHQRCLAGSGNAADGDDLIA